ncbi:MAG: ATP-dependent DNA helicase RecG [Cyclobacteriaceae bacterium]|jgi:ATP-dependent DNA helicase RecG|nr:ATP-dependent DNA helicase RecG [Cyclobacteriaceae bacterium]
MSDFFQTKIEFLKGVGSIRAKLLNEELGIHTIEDLLFHFPFRYEDRTSFCKINQIDSETTSVQIKGRVIFKEEIGTLRKKRLLVHLRDETGQIELVWFKGINWISNKIKNGIPYIVYGKPSFFNGSYNISHPEIEILTKINERGYGSFLPVYSSTEKLRKHYVDTRAIGKLQEILLSLSENRIEETLSPSIINKYKFLTRRKSLENIHFPENGEMLKKALNRLKFEELFYIQLGLIKEKKVRKQKFRGLVLNESKLVTEFYNKFIPFELTNSQKEVIKEIYADLRSGSQMNRLLQGDVGSGKTIIAFICMLIALSSDTQAAIMAPTEILANQHFIGLQEFADQMDIQIILVTGSTKKSQRIKSLEGLKNGEIKIIVGTHALLEKDVQFKKLGLAVIDEQHKFGVAQRARLWQKNDDIYPHVLVMTATPIPRTLAMTLYGDLEISTIKELPKGRKPIYTTHMRDSGRLKLFGFIRKQIDLGSQIYIVYPLIEESANFDYKDLMDGYESIARAFPEIPLSIVHGKMKPKDKDYEMQRFIINQTKILVATTVIEVGVNVPNATVMVIENAERFGLSQLHQLRGRVGRGADQSYCILMTGNKLSNEAKERIKTMVETNDGFIIAETDLKIRGPGDMMGTQQSGVLDLHIANLATDGKILKEARICAEQILEDDPYLDSSDNNILKITLERSARNKADWSIIS